MDNDMQELVESIRENGLINPIILRKKDDARYEIVSGHRRKKACELIGMRSVPADVRTMTRDEAMMILVDSNLHRSNVLPSEKAFAYKIKLEAMNRQGKRTDLTSAPVEQKLDSREQLAKSLNESHAQIQRYIRLTRLSKRILEMVDEGRISMRPAVEISYLSDKEQELLSEAMELTDCTPSHAQAIRLRQLSSEGKLCLSAMEKILSEEKPNQKEQIRVRFDSVSRYLPKDLLFSDAEQYILKALAFYQKYRNRELDDRYR